MSFITYQIETELECQRITSELEALNIPFTVKKYGDRSFPMLGPLRAFAEITIETRYSEQMQKILDQPQNKKSL